MSAASAVFAAEQAPKLLSNTDAGFALPSSWYTSDAVFEQESEHVLRRGWHYGGHTGQLSKAGDQVVCNVAGVPIVLVVDDAREIRGFVNICRHRAHTIVQAPQNRRTLQCMYHGWTYGLDGCLRRAPRAEGELDFDPTEFGLIPVQVAVWGPTVWVNPDLKAPPFSDWTRGLPELVASHGVDVDRHVYALEREWEIRANWKVFLDNAIECYHCPTCHSALSQVLEMDPALHQMSVGGRYWISHRIPLRANPATTLIAAPTAVNGETPGMYDFHWIFPTTYFQYAGRGFDVGTVDVRDVDKIVFRHIVFLPDDATPEEIAERDQRLDVDPTVGEDVDICHRVQHAHEADFAPPGRLMPGSEAHLLHFQRVLVEDMSARANGGSAVLSA